MPRKRISSWKSRDMWFEPWSWRSPRPLAAFRSTLPKWRSTPWRTGSSASKRLPERAAWLPTHSPEQWSTATNTLARPSRRVTVSVMSVPHMASTAVVVMVPSWARSVGRPTRCGASRPCRPIRRRTRRAEVRMPTWRRRARILRQPSPCRREPRICVRMRSANSASGQAPTGPRRVGRAGASAPAAPRWR